MRTLSVDQELSPLVQRSFDLVDSVPESHSTVPDHPFKASLVVNAAPTAPTLASSLERSSETHDMENTLAQREKHAKILKTEYRATTNRMLRVAVNGFFESMGTVVQVMEELDTNVLHEKGYESLDGVQGIEQGMTGSTG